MAIGLAFKFGLPVGQVRRDSAVLFGKALDIPIEHDHFNAVARKEAGSDPSPVEAETGAVNRHEDVFGPGAPLCNLRVFGP
jgi:hypothetical protein